MKRQKINIREVAAMAGVSIATVSQIMNGATNFSAVTERRVYDAVKKLNYVPDLNAQALRRRNSNTIALLLSNLNNLFYSKIMSEFIALAEPRGYQVQILSFEYSVEAEKKLLLRLMNGNIKIIFIINGYGDEEVIQQLVAAEKYVVLIDREAKEGTSNIEFDNSAALFDAVGFLYREHYKKIGFITEPLLLDNIKKRHATFLEACHKFHYAEPDKNVYIGQNLQLNNLENGYEMMKDILNKNEIDELPDAWIASSDMLAIGIIRAFHEYSIGVPEKFGVIGFDNTQLSGYVVPGLTTIEQNQVVLANKMWEIVEQYRKDAHKLEHICLKQKFIIRDSC